MRKVGALSTSISAAAGAESTHPAKLHRLSDLCFSMGILEQRRFEEAGTEKVWWGRYREGLGGGVQRSLEDVPRPCSF